MDSQTLNYEIHFTLTMNGLESESVNELALELALNNPRLKDSIRGAAMNGVPIPFLGSAPAHECGFFLTRHEI